MSLVRFLDLVWCASLTVPDILFTGDDAVLPSSALSSHYVKNFSTLRSMGNQLMSQLAQNLGLASGTSTFTTTSTPTPSSSGSCSWSGHCIGRLSVFHWSWYWSFILTLPQGASCSSENDCSGNLVCKSGKCARPWWSLTRNIEAWSMLEYHGNIPSFHYCWNWYMEMYTSSPESHLQMFTGHNLTRFESLGL